MTLQHEHITTRGPHATQSFTIRDVARRTGFSGPTLRYYEKIGLIPSVPRGESSKHREYSLDDLHLVEALASLRMIGLSVAEMRRYMQGMDQGRDGANSLIELFQDHSETLSSQIVTLQTRQRYIDTKVALWEARMRGEHEDERRMLARLATIADELGTEG
jgi:DNA-binding transcriptional MerR regulator